MRRPAAGAVADRPTDKKSSRRKNSEAGDAEFDALVEELDQIGERMIQRLDRMHGLMEDIKRDLRAAAQPVPNQHTTIKFYEFMSGVQKHRDASLPAEDQP